LPKITPAEKEQLLAEKASGARNKDLAKKYKLCVGYISVLARAKSASTPVSEDKPVTYVSAPVEPKTLKQLRKAILESESKHLKENEGLYQAIAKRLYTELEKKAYRIKSLTWQPFIPKTDYQSKNPAVDTNRYEVTLYLTQAQIDSLPSWKKV
jgi:hypothetical protein